MQERRRADEAGAAAASEPAASESKGRRELRGLSYEEQVGRVAPEGPEAPAVPAAPGLLDEAKMTATLSHPNVAQVIDLETADDEVLLVIGSSLTVFSGYRFVLRANERGQDVAVLNLGPTRADADARVKLEARAGEVLPGLLERLRRSG